MNAKLISELKKMSEVDYLHLELIMQVAKLIRTVMRDFEKDDKFMCEYFHIKPAQFKAWKNGACDFPIRDLARIQALQADLGIQRVQERIRKQVQLENCQ